MNDFDRWVRVARGARHAARALIAWALASAVGYGLAGLAERGSIDWPEPAIIALVPMVAILGAGIWLFLGLRLVDSLPPDAPRRAAIPIARLALVAGLIGVGYGIVFQVRGLDGIAADLDSARESHLTGVVFMTLAVYLSLFAIARVERRCEIAGLASKLVGVTPILWLLAIAFDWRRLAGSLDVDILISAIALALFAAAVFAATIAAFYRVAIALTTLWKTPEVPSARVVDE